MTMLVNRRTLLAGDAATGIVAAFPARAAASGDAGAMRELDTIGQGECTFGLPLIRTFLA